MTQHHVTGFEPPAASLLAARHGQPRFDLQQRALPAPTTGPLLQSFWMAGFEGADQINGAGMPLSMCDITQHRDQAAADYARLAALDVRAVRETAGWRLLDRRGKLDFTPLKSRARAARAHRMQVIWTLFHYGWPADLNVFSAAFVDRFARYARAAAAYLGEFSDHIPIYAPINEISFLAWSAGFGGNTHGANPAIAARGDEFKCQLVRAAIAACDAILDVDPRARFIHTDPLMHVVAPIGRDDLAAAVARRRELQFEAWDMLSGRRCPQLGGAPRYLDIVGLNYYWTNQWEFTTGRPLRWQFDDPRRMPLSQLLTEVRTRFGRPMMIAETSHSGVRRANWLREVAAEVALARNHGAPLEGVCLYPVLDRPDWNNTSLWHDCGLWHLERTCDGVLHRRLNDLYAAELRRAQHDGRTVLDAAERWLPRLRPALTAPDAASPAT
ncbi:MAG: hypothetical protein JWN94_1682 [Betaproteobacteria bacterium]|nr:hypothetical protein [Betaproteobacteria bacterium]